MAKNINHIQHVKSNVVIEGKPKLPTSDVLVEGELAINYASGVETISLKNSSGGVVAFSSDDYYSEKKLGSGFTNENSAKTVTSVIGEISSSLNALSGKSVVNISSSNNSISTNSSTTVDGSVKYDITTDASKISGLTKVDNSDEGAAKISGVSTTDSVKTGIKRLYDSLSSEIAARKAAIINRRVNSANKAISVSEIPNGDGYETTITLTLDSTTNGVGDEKTGNDNALTITNNGLFLSSSWNCGDF